VRQQHKIQCFNGLALGCAVHAEGEAQHRLCWSLCPASNTISNSQLERGAGGRKGWGTHIGAISHIVEAGQRHAWELRLFHLRK
jgi:hypothetical protein